MPPIADATLAAAATATAVAVMVFTPVNAFSKFSSSSSATPNPYPPASRGSGSSSASYAAAAASSSSRSASGSQRNLPERSGPTVTSTSRPTHSSSSSSRLSAGRPITSTIPRPTTKMYTDDRRAILRSIADQTLETLDRGLYAYKGIDYKVDGWIQESQKNTRYYDPEGPVSSWSSTQPRKTNHAPAYISVLQISTLDAARLLENLYRMKGHERGKTGVLNFASATQPGGGFKNGAEAQEESIARSSTLYRALAETEEAAKFYNFHLEMKRKFPQHAYYTHAIIYSPNIYVFRDDDGVWTYPFPIDVLSCAAVNAGEVRKANNTPVQAGLEVEIEKVMAERMGRILYVFEKHGVRNLVLGTFGTGVFRNNVAIVARLWAHLLVGSEARFKNSFERIIFAITGEETFAEFQSAFDAWCQPSAPRPSNGNGGGFARGDLIQF